jgi:hypothetical protein
MNPGNPVILAEKHVHPVNLVNLGYMRPEGKILSKMNPVQSYQSWG